MENLRTHFISGAKYCRPCGLGFVADDSLSVDQARTLGLIISECMASIYDPGFASIARKLGIPDENVPTLADLGVLIHAEATKQHGIRILYQLPDWIAKYERGVKLAFSVRFSTAVRAFVEDFAPDALWAIKFSINDPAFVKAVEKRLGISVNYSPLWVGVDGVEKLRQIDMECQFADETMKQEYSEQIQRASHFISQIQDNESLTNMILDVNDGSIVPGIGLRKQTILN